MKRKKKNLVAPIISDEKTPEVPGKETMEAATGQKEPKPVKKEFKLEPNDVECLKELDGLRTAYIYKMGVAAFGFIKTLKAESENIEKIGLNKNGIMTSLAKKFKVQTPVDNIDLKKGIIKFK